MEALSRELLIETQRIAHIGNWEWDVAANRVTWSEELHRIYGVGPGEFGGTYEAFLDRVLPEDRERTRAVVFDAYREVKPFTYDHRIVRPDGTVRMLHTRGDVMADEHGKVVRMCGVCWDTTEIWQAAREREESLSLLRATLESTADGVLVIDRDGRVTAHNQRLLDMWRVPREELAGKDIGGLFELVKDQLENAEASLRALRELEAHPEAESFEALRFRDGRHFELYSRPQRIGDRIVGRVLSYRDVTDRERVLLGAIFLADASRLLATLEVEKALEAVAHLSLTYLADACAVDLVTDGEPRRLLVLSRDPGRPMSDNVPSATTSGGAATYMVGSSSRLTVPLRAHGDLLGALTFGAPRGRRYGEADLTLLAELGRRVELALENATLYHEARDALAARDEFLSIAAHEIRGPITALHLAVQGLLRAPPEPAATRMLAAIEREDHRLARFVDELLDVSRIRSRQLHFVFAPVDLVEVAREVVTRMAAELAQSGSSLSFTAPGQVVGTWDRMRLEQVVGNLLSNAIKFGLGKPVELRIESDGETAKLVVRDQGIGIAADARRRVFSPFERAVSSRQFGGLGLGLYIVRTIVDGMGGAVRLDSRPGAGATFTVELPLARRA